MTDPLTGTDPDHVVVEQAKGVVMLRYGVSPDDSLAAMTRWAREAHVAVPDLARALVEGICQGRVTPETQGMVRWLEHRLRAEIREAPEALEPVARPHVPAARRTPAEVRRSPATTTADARLWRYTSAVHAARSLSSP